LNQRRQRDEAGQLALLESIFPAPLGFDNYALNAVGLAIVARDPGLDEVALDLARPTMVTCLRSSLLYCTVGIGSSGGVIRGHLRSNIEARRRSCLNLTLSLGIMSMKLSLKRRKWKKAETPVTGVCGHIAVAWMARMGVRGDDGAKIPRYLQVPTLFT
jgi:hypothetical protein